jgi:hypothetical protein
MSIISRTLFVTLICASVGFAAPIIYIVDFSLGPGRVGLPNFDILPAAGGFTFDSANPATPFSDFTVLWRGVTFDLTAVANTRSSPGFGCDSETSAPNLGANIMFQSFTSPCVNVSYDWAGIYNYNLGIEQFAFSARSLSQTLIDTTSSIGIGDISQSGGGTWTLSVAPEPASIGQLAVGLVGIACLWGWPSLNRARRKRSADNRPAGPNVGYQAQTRPPIFGR